jgi:phosphate transport system substrate-binding protein
VTRPLAVFPVLCALGVMAGCSTPPMSDRPPSTLPATNGGDAGDAGGPAGASVSDGPLTPYAPVPSLSGKITSIGASTTMNLVARAAAEFRRIYPDVKQEAMAGLASIGPPALLEGRADIVPMNRRLRPEEIREFQKKYGYPPTEIRVAADALTIFVERKNPVTGLTLEQLDGIFSRTQRRGGPSIETWDQVGLAGEWADRRIILYGYGPGDGANDTFRTQVLRGGEYRLSLLIEPAGSAIVQDVAANPSAVGCASIFFASKRVRAVPLAGADGTFYAPTEENVRQHRYPLSRFLYVYVNKPPGRPLGGPSAEFLRFLLSREGQQIVAADGNIPLDAATAEQGRRAIE